MKRAKTLDRQYLEPYAGKWVAIIDEGVVAVGETPDEVLAKAEGIRPGMEPEVIKVPRKDEGQYVL